MKRIFRARVLVGAAEGIDDVELLARQLLAGELLQLLPCSLRDGLVVVLVFVAKSTRSYPWWSRPSRRTCPWANGRYRRRSSRSRRPCRLQLPFSKPRRPFLVSSRNSSSYEGLYTISVTPVMPYFFKSILSIIVFVIKTSLSNSIRNFPGLSRRRLRTRGKSLFSRCKISKKNDNVKKLTVIFHKI